MSFHILADEDTIIGYRFAGVQGTPVETDAEARKEFRRITREKSCRILVVSSKVAELLGDDLTNHRLASAPPYVVEISDIWKSGPKRRNLVEMIQEAVGIRILKKQD